MKGFFSVLVLVVVTVGLSAEPDFGAALGPAPVPSQVLTRPQVQALLTLAAQEHWNLFDLLDEGAQWLRARGRTVRIVGDDLRAMTGLFDLGDTRIDAMVPVASLVSLTFGGSSQAAAFAELVLSHPVSGFLELGDFSLAERYGFRAIVGKTLGAAFGMKVKNGFFAGEISQIERVPDPTGRHDPNFIAIHASGLLRPKRWQIDPVKVLGPGRPAQPPTP